VVVDLRLYESKEEKGNEVVRVFRFYVLLHV